MNSYYTMFKRAELRRKWLLFQVLIWATVLTIFLYMSAQKPNEPNYILSHLTALEEDSNKNEIFKKFDKERMLSDLDQWKQLEGFKKAKIIDENNLKFFRRVQRQKYNVNCHGLLEWNEQDIRNTKRQLFQIKSSSISDSVPLLQDENFIFDKSMCKYYKSVRGFNKFQITDFEYDFPIAFTILTYEHVEQFERMLRLIYRPHNVYCIHVDTKSSNDFIKAINSITACFPNVFISTKSERIVYASFSRLKADLNCMEDLIKPNYSHINLANKHINPNWKYLLNLASTEFPLRTNYELARILSVFNGANDIEVLSNFQKDRILNRWIVKKSPKTNKETLIKTKLLKSSVPHNFTIVKGITYCSFSRKFVEYVLTNHFANNLLQWSRDTYSPDEWFWATLNFNTQFNPPGGYKDAKVYTVTRTRFIGWKQKYNCKGKLRHNICIFSIEDIPKLTPRPEFFLNKFLLDYDPITFQCMEEWITNKVSLNQTADVSSYCRLSFVKPYSVHPSCTNLY